MKFSKRIVQFSKTIQNFWLFSSLLAFTGAAQGLKIDGANKFQTRAIVANFLIYPKMWIKWCNFPKFDGALSPSAPLLCRPCTDTDWPIFLSPLESCTTFRKLITEHVDKGGFQIDMKLSCINKSCPLLHKNHCKFN